MKLFYLILFIPILCSNVLAQRTIMGEIQDSNNRGLYGATVVLLETTDSTMVSFTITDDNGAYGLSDIDTGNYVLQLSYVGFDNYKSSVSVTNEDVRMPTIVLSESTQLIQEVTIKAEHIPMGIKGDTISYNAAAFRTREGASVEDLLKKMPGIEVDRAGRIKAQGKEVENVLVDGKEFFGNDPLIATKNLEAEAIDKVQVFDKKSDIAEFTGIDDGEEEKTINLQLKEDYKNGGFGTVTAQGGNKNTWLGKLNYNRFSTKMQASILAAGNNINEQAFSFNEYISFMGGLGNAIAAGGLNGSNSLSGNNNVQEGLSDNKSIGTNLNYDFSKKVQLHSNYFYGGSKNDLDKNTIGENFNTSTSFSSSDTELHRSNTHNHKLNTKLIYKANPLTEWVIRNNFQLTQGDKRQNSSSEYRTMGLLKSMAIVNQDKSNNQQALESNIQLKRKFKTKGRNWINQLNFKRAVEDENLDLFNELNSINDRIQIRQNQDFNNKRSELSISSNYTEPMGKSTYWGLGYSLLNSQEQPAKDFFDISMSESIFNEALSSKYQKEYSFHSINSSIRKNTKKAKWNFGLTSQWTQLNGIIDNGQRSINRMYHNFLPSANLKYKLSRSKNLDLSYYTQITAPTLTQLMPLPNNADPNNLYIGNVELIPEYNHNFSLSYNAFDQFNSSSFFFYANFTSSDHKIINRVFFNEDLTRTVTPINVDKFNTTYSSLSYSSPLRPLKINTRLNMNIQSSQYESFVNTTINEVGENNLNLSLKIDNRKKDNVDISAGLRVNFTNRSYSINREFNQNFVNYDWFLEGDVFLSPTTTLTSSFDYRTYSGEFFSDARNFKIWNLEISQSFLKNKLTLSVIGRDLLNQNQGINRFGDATSLNQSTYNTLSRYAMIGLSYKLGKTKKKNDGLSIEFE